MRSIHAVITFMVFVDGNVLSVCAIWNISGTLINAQLIENFHNWPRWILNWSTQLWKETNGNNSTSKEHIFAF